MIGVAVLSQGFKGSHRQRETERNTKRERERENGIRLLSNVWGKRMYISEEIER